jgi:hypothetical protein
MDRTELLPILSMFTLGSVFIALLVYIAIYWSNRNNRPPKDGGPPTRDGST